MIINKKISKIILKWHQILLELDEVRDTGLIRAQIAYSYAICSVTIANIVNFCVKSGITDIVRYNINLIPVPHGVNWTDAVRYTSFRWPVSLCRKGIRVGHYSF